MSENYYSNVQSQIDQMVADRAEAQRQIDDMTAVASASNHVGGRMTSNHGSQEQVKVDHTGVTMTVQRTADRIPDDGINTAFALSQLDATIKGLVEKAEAHTFNSVTGEKEYVMAPHIRAAALLNIQNMLAQREWQADRYGKLEEQRARDTQFREAEADERARRFELTGGDPRREARLSEIIADEELRLGAKAILAARYERML